MINDHLYEGRFTPTNADGKRISRNIYAQTREKCEKKLAMLIVEMKAEIKAEKERRKQVGSKKDAYAERPRRVSRRGLQLDIGCPHET